MGTCMAIDKDWRDALAGYIRDEKLLAEGTPEEIITKFMQMVREVDWRWREEIEKYIPQLGVMSFAGPKATIRWLMERVEIKPEDAKLTANLLAIEASSIPEDDKIDQRLQAIFPNLGKRIE